MAVYKNSVPFGNIVTDGLVLNLDATNINSYPTTGSTWFDTSFYRYSASLTNGTSFLQERGRGSMVFDGINDRVTIASSSLEPTGLQLGPSTGYWMVNVWIKTTAAGSNALSSFPILTNQAGGPVYSLMGIAAGGVPKYSHYSGSWLVESGSIAINSGNWNMVSWVNSNNTMSLYVNNTFDKNVSSIIVGGGNINPVDSIGWGWVAYLSCSISSVLIYKRSYPYTDQEVQQNYNALKSRFGL